MATFFEVSTKHSGKMLVNMELVEVVVRSNHGGGCELIFADGDPVTISDSYEQVLLAIRQEIGPVRSL